MKSKVLTIVLLFTTFALKATKQRITITQSIKPLPVKTCMFSLHLSLLNT